jgi:hypothetical protein
VSRSKKSKTTALFQGGDSIEALREFISQHRKEGLTCLACDQHVQEYRWAPYKSSITVLGKLYRHRRDNGETYIHSSKVKLAGHGGHASQLARWGLVEFEPHPRGDGGKTGRVRITDKGAMFFTGAITITKYCWVFNNEVLYFEGPPISVYDIVGDFNFNEHMQAIA